jgi:hypothetical protein
MGRRLTAANDRLLPSGSNRSHINIGWILLGLGLFAPIWFVAALRERIRLSEQATPEEGTLSTLVPWAKRVYLRSHGWIALADGVKTMSDDTYQQQVYSGVIHAANDATYIMVVTGGAGMAALISPPRSPCGATRSCRAGSAGRLRGLRRGNRLGHLLHDAVLAALDAVASVALFWQRGRRLPRRRRGCTVDVRLSRAERPDRIAPCRSAPHPRRVGHRRSALAVASGSSGISVGGSAGTRILAALVYGILATVVSSTSSS